MHTDGSLSSSGRLAFGIFAALDSDHTLVAVVELSFSCWLVAGVVPGAAG
jgi:hypothetical protein